jgi:sarcosine oxidase/L-pipecolate oxidase
LIVGCGVFGIAAALELRRRGIGVTVIDPGPLPTPQASSTDIGKAIRMDYGDDEIYTSMMEVALEGWSKWNRDWGRELYHPTGMLFMSRDEMTPGGFEYESYNLIEKRGHPLERIRSEDLKKRFPKWNPTAYPDGYFNPHAGWAESGEVVRQLVLDGRDAGVKIREGVNIESLLQIGSRVQGVVTDRGEEIRADLTLVAAGAWTPTLLP